MGEKGDAGRRNKNNKPRGGRARAGGKTEKLEISSYSCFSTVPLAQPTNGTVTALATRARTGDEEMHTLRSAATSAEQIGIAKYYVAVFYLRTRLSLRGV